MSGVKKNKKKHWIHIIHDATDVSRPDWHIQTPGTLQNVKAVPFLGGHKTLDPIDVNAIWHVFVLEFWQLCMHVFLVKQTVVW